MNGPAALAKHPMTSDVLTTREHHGVVTLTLNRPAQHNALSEELLGSLQAEIERLGTDKAVRCVVVAGAGKAFCAGHDLREMRGHSDEAYFRDLFARCSRVMRAIRALPMPVIAQVHGIATAAGCQLVAACDLAVAGRSARFAVSGINVGLFCATPAVALSRNMSMKAALDMLLTGRFIDAEEAWRLGLVNNVVDDEALEEAVRAHAAEICRKSAEAVRVGKRMFYAQAEMTLADAYSFAGDTMARSIMHDDAKRGIDAFLAKRR